VLLITLGSLKLQPDGFQRPKLLLLIAYLKLEGAKPRDHLRMLFWPDAADANASLRVALAQIRQAMPGVLQEDGSLLSAHVSCDAIELIEALDTGTLNRAVTLYAGAFLDGVALSDLGLELEEWVLTTRELIAGRVQDAQLRLAEEALLRHDPREAQVHATAAHRLSGAPPLEPERLARLHAVLESVGSPQANEVRLEAEGLGLVLNRQETAIGQRPVPSNLPSRLNSFISREQEHASLLEMLGTSEVRLVTLVGLGGVGKSRLALEVARSVQQTRQFPDGVFVVFLEAIDSSTAMISELLRVLEVPLESDDAPQVRLTEWLRHRQVLVLLDNFEHLVPITGLLDDLLETCPAIKFLVTSRERLGSAAEWVLPLEGLPIPTSTHAEPWASQDAIALFDHRAKRLDPTFVLGDHHAGVLEVCRQVLGFPLAIELAAALIRVMSPATLANELRRDADVLAAVHGMTDDRHRGLRAVFTHSWSLLRPMERTTLMRLSVFRNGASRASVAEVCQVNLVPLVSLVEKSLVQSDHTGRYQIHPLIAQYALEQLEAEPEEAGQVRVRHAEHFLGLLATATARLRGAESRQGVTEIIKDWENIRAGWQRALQAAKFALLEPVQDIVLFFDSQGRANEGLDLFEYSIQVLEEAPPTPGRDPVLASVLVNAAWLHYRLNKHEPALQRAEAGASIARSLGHAGESTLSKALNTLGSIASAMNDLKQAMTYGLEALELARRQNDKWREGICLINLGNAESSLGLDDQAQIHLEQALDLATMHGNPANQVIAHISLAHHLLFAAIPGPLDQVLDILETGLNLAHTESLNGLEPRLKLLLATVHLQLGQPSEARAWAQVAWEDAQAQNDELMSAQSWAELGLVAQALGEVGLARKHFHESLQQAQKLRKTFLELDCVLYLGLLDLDTNGMRRDWAHRALHVVALHPASNAWHRREAAQKINHEKLESTSGNAEQEFGLVIRLMSGLVS
jgi:predicted ATPase/DNA-binding SARP family transcriptional activator